MTELLTVLLKVSLVIFMAGSLLDMGLRLRFREALEGLRNVRFVTLSLLWGFVLCPAFAWLLTRVVPLEEHFAMGLILLGMTPCAPFLPMMVERARGDMAYAAGFMLLASVVMVAYMPLAVPVLATGLTVSAWTIAKPLLALVLVPLAIGMVILRVAESVAARLHPFVRNSTSVAAVILLLMCAAVYGNDFRGVVGSYAIAVQIVFFSVVTAVPYWLSCGLAPRQKSVLSLGLTTRNLGVALTPLFSIPDIDQRSIIMIVLAVPMQLIFAVLAARWFARRANRA
jgi:BASS family bile acid:Na+ symporter